jgi:hypothetical protein
MSNEEVTSPNKGQVLLYQTQDNLTRIDVLLDHDTVWLTQTQMADLFQTSKQNVSLHIKNVYKEGELVRESTVKEFLTVQKEGQREVSRSIEYYNLDVIISVGYRVKSLRGTQFRIWATQRLREFLVKGFVLDDDRLSEGRTEPRYFDELITRIRAIRASERNFYRKVQDIYATSIDYDPSEPITKEFFATVQNKLHWAVHGKTAAEVIAHRADASKPNMGLTSWKGTTLTKNDTLIAKNYLSQDELEVLNLLVSQYLDFAELQARAKKPMYMRDWAAKLHDFLKVNDREILKDAGRISRKMAEELATKEFEKYQTRLALQDVSPFHPDLEAQLRRHPMVKAPESSRKERVRKKRGEQAD